MATEVKSAKQFREEIMTLSTHFMWIDKWLKRTQKAIDKERKMAATLTIKVEIKEAAKESINLTIDREIRLILRDNLETAIEDARNELICDYHYETDLVKVQISNL